CGRKGNSPGRACPTADYPTGLWLREEIRTLTQPVALKGPLLGLRMTEMPTVMLCW
ncbi:hypothetical protein M9458_030762, partial [Cirrhinus mrigala]